MSTTQYLEWAGAILGLLGAFLLATNTRFSRYGWVAFFSSECRNDCVCFQNQCRWFATPAGGLHDYKSYWFVPSWFF